MYCITICDKVTFKKEHFQHVTFMQHVVVDILGEKVNLIIDLQH